MLEVHVTWALALASLYVLVQLVEMLLSFTYGRKDGFDRLAETLSGEVE